MPTTALLAGATGMLGHRIAVHLLEQPDVDHACSCDPRAHPTRPELPP